MATCLGTRRYAKRSSGDEPEHPGGVREWVQGTSLGKWTWDAEAKMKGDERGMAAQGQQQRFHIARHNAVRRCRSWRTHPTRSGSPRAAAVAIY